MESRDLNKEEFDAWQVSKKELDDIYFTDELYWQQRARDQWLKEGDNNKTFFQKSATIRKKANLILSMEIDGEISDSLPEIRNHILDFYKNLFAVEHIKKINFEANFWDKRYCLSESDRGQLEMPFSEQEIRSAVFGSDAQGAPGPDGFSFLFYQHFYELIKDDLITLLTHFHSQSLNM